MSARTRRNITVVAHIMCAMRFALIIPQTQALPEAVPIGGLFETGENEQKQAFLLAVEDVNRNHDIGVQLVAREVSVPQLSTYHTEATVCELMGSESGVSGIFGPSSPVTAGHVQSICDTMEIPHVQWLCDLYLNRETCSINLYPHHSTLADILIRYLTKYQWIAFTLLYEDDESLVRLGKLVKVYDTKGIAVKVRQIPEGVDVKPVFRDILNDGDTHIILDCSIERLYSVLVQAQQIGVMGEKYNYVITNLDFHTLEVEPFRYSRTNMTGFRIINPSNPLVREAAMLLDGVVNANSEDPDGELTRSSDPNVLRLDTALVWDAVHVFAHALARLDSSRDVELAQLQCEKQSMWEHGQSLINFMRTTEIQGLTGTIKFDNQGFRTEYSLEVLAIQPEGNALQTVATIDQYMVNDTMEQLEKENNLKMLETIQNKTLRVRIAMSEPYNMLKDSASTLSGNDRYEGFCIDLIKELSLMLGFNYTFVEQPDGAYGTCWKDENDKVVCDGMLEAVIEGKADLAVTDLTITYQRALGVDFTKPFMSLGIGLLHTMPRPLDPSLFSFLDPFSNEVWVYLAAVYIVVSVELYVMARLTPAEWNNPYPCIQEPEELENQFSVMNSFWFTIGAMMQQGSEIAPIAVSTRMVAGMWWFFTLIMVSSYTANLAAFLTVEPKDELITDPKQLLDHPTIKYGAKLGGATLSFFNESSDPIYRKMFYNMVNMKDNDGGKDRVVRERGTYAFFMESSSIEYQAQRECDVRQVGANLDAKGYGIAMRQNAEYLSALSAGVVQLAESGKLTELKTRWWEQRRGGGKCHGNKDSEGGAEELGLPNVGGVFLVLAVGSAAAFLLAVAEFLMNLYAKAVKEGISFREEVWEEVKFICKCRGSSKPVKKDSAPDEALEEALKDFQPLSPYAVTSNGPGNVNATTANNGIIITKELRY